MRLYIYSETTADQFIVGDVLFDLLRQWTRAETLINFDSGYPTLNESTIEAAVRATLTSVKANGFDVNTMAVENTDSTPVMSDLNTFDSESKSDTDEFVFTDKTAK